MANVVILTGNHLCHNPRVIKEGLVLAAAGYEVQVLGAWFDSTLKARDQELLPGLPFRFSPVIDLTQSSVSHFGCRFRMKAGQLAFHFGGMDNSWQFGYAASALRRIARRSEADLFIAHSEPALMTARDLLRTQRRVSVDMEDWFSEDLLPEARWARPVSLLRDLEQMLLRGAAYSSCPSRAMSDALTNEFNCHPPAVVYNAFDWTERRSLDGALKDRKDRLVPSVHWYSQTLGPGRGLEDLLAALVYLNHDAEIHLRGKPVNGFEDWLTSRVPDTWHKWVFVHGLVPNRELLSRIAEHDIGFAGEMKYCRSRDLTVTNKILHYLLAGLAVVASDTTGQREVARQAPGAVFLYPCGDAVALAEQLNELLRSPECLANAKTKALLAAKETFCWEKCGAALIQSVERALCLPN